MKGDPERDERLAKALRENLKRRKARGRVRENKKPTKIAEEAGLRPQEAAKRI